MIDLAESNLPFDARKGNVMFFYSRLCEVYLLAR